jgi:indolepyruvate ferredoxin oxidoreductase, beta subunit
LAAIAALPRLSEFCGSKALTRHDKSGAAVGPGPSDGILKLAVMAVGGQGGGVLTNWIETLARAQGYTCQATSVAGVAQRTGATIYYVEMAPAQGAAPVFSLAPSAGDVDIVIAAEMMEAGRAIMRGFVTPDRTTLIASTHRALAVSEKSVPGDGIAAAGEVRAAAELAAQHLVMFDMERTAQAAGSVISASLFGALAGTGRLPFDRVDYEAAIRAGGKGVGASLKAFGAAYLKTRGSEPDLRPPADVPAAVPVDAPGGPDVTGPPALLNDWNALVARVAELPIAVQAIAMAGLRKTVDFQDIAYGSAYLDRLFVILARDSPHRGYVLTREAAKHIANAMAYDDIIKVADLKSRGGRFERIGRDMALRPDQQMHLTEYFHPRAEEIAGLLPARAGARIISSPRAMARLDRWFARGRHLRSDRLPAFLLLYVLGGRRSWRLKTLRHAQETAHLETWLALAMGRVGADYDLAVELLRCRRLIKGYSDTHARGLSKFDRVCGAATLLAGREDAADWIRRLREAALLDEAGDALEGALQTVRSFAGDKG